MTEFSDTIIVENGALLPRNGIASAIVSFPRGALVAGETPVGLTDEHGNMLALDLLPGRWPDGSPRRGLAQYPVRMFSASEEVRRVKLSDGTPPPPTHTATLSPSFDWSPALVAAIGGLQVNQQGGTKWGALECVADFTLVKVLRRRGRSILQPGVWCEITYTLYSGQPYIHFSFRPGWSDPSTKDLTTHAALTLVVSGAQPVVRGEQSKVISTTFEDGEWRLTFHDGRIGDGQSQLVYGTLLLPGFTSEQDRQTIEAERMSPLQCSSTSWRAHKTFGPYGYAPECSPQEAIAWAMDGYSRLEAHDPWQAAWFGLPPWGSQTGHQDAFANQVAHELTAHPRGNLMMQLNCAQEACRAIYFREPDASPVTFTKRPLALRWCGRPQLRVHWIDALGKLHDPGDYSNQYRGHEHGATTARGGEWLDADTEHKRPRSYLTALATTVYDPAAIALCEEGVEILMSEYPPLGTGWGDTQAAPRTSRGLYELCWLATVVNDALAERVKQHVLARIRQIVLPAFARGPGGPVVCSQWFEPSDQSGGLMVNHWRPWECAETARLLGAAAALWEAQDVAQARDELCDSIVEHGIIERPDGFQIATAMAWRDGAPHSGADYANPALFKPADGTAYLLWALAAVQQATTPKARAVEQFIFAAWGKGAEAWRVR